VPSHFVLPPRLTHHGRDSSNGLPKCFGSLKAALERLDRMNVPTLFL
jgi:hypothetical protein